MSSSLYIHIPPPQFLFPRLHVWKPPSSQRGCSPNKLSSSPPRGIDRGLYYFGNGNAQTGAILYPPHAQLLATVVPATTPCNFVYVGFSVYVGRYILYWRIGPNRISATKGLLPSYYCYWQEEFLSNKRRRGVLWLYGTRAVPCDTVMPLYWIKTNCQSSSIFSLFRETSMFFTSLFLHPSIQSLQALKAYKCNLLVHFYPLGKKKNFFFLP